MTRYRKFISLLIVVCVACLGAVGLVSASGSSQTPLAAAIAATKASEHGTNKTPDTTSRPVASGKKLFIINAGAASESSNIPALAAEQAAKVLGWNVTILDGKLNPSSWAGLVTQAIAQGANGIIMDAIDCSSAQGPLQAAKAKGIVVVPIYAFDCNDPVGGSKSGPQLFTTCENYAGRPCAHLQDFTKSYGAAQANYIIAKSSNKAKILLINDTDHTVLKYTATGFSDQIKASKGSQIVGTLNFTDADLITGKLKGMVQRAVLQHKNATWVKSPFAAATTFGGIGAVASGAHMKVMGGEGFPDELALLSNGQVTAVNVISSQWTGWAAVDAMNSAFTKKPTHPSGIGWTIVDKSSPKPQNVPYQAAYKKAWGK